MRWNWNKKEWPVFIFDSAAVAAYESLFLKGSGVLIGSFRHLAEEEKVALNIELMSEEALKTSAIEGEYLNRDSLQSSIRRQFGLQTDGRKVSPAEAGIAGLMVRVYETWDEPLSHDTLYAWHTLLARGRIDLQDLGCYRSSSQPMQVVSGSIYEPKVHFEAPPSAQVFSEMNQFVNWFNETLQTRSLPALTRAAIAHLYFVSIHPFEDGNGRMGRAISEKALSQNLGEATLIALARTIEVKRKAYYEALERNNKRLEITDWIVYFAETVLEAQAYTIRCVEFLIEKAKFFDRFLDEMNDRQHKVVTRMFLEGLDGFKGGLSADNYIRITKTSASTATRDLQRLVECGAFIRVGERKHTRYYLNIMGQKPMFGGI